MINSILGLWYQARDNLGMIFEKVVNERRLKNERTKSKIGKMNMLDQMLASEDEEGRKFSDEKIGDLIILSAFGGLLSSAVTATWALIYLQQHPQVLHKAKVQIIMSIFFLVIYWHNT